MLLTAIPSAEAASFCNQVIKYDYIRPVRQGGYLFIKKQRQNLTAAVFLLFPQTRPAAVQYEVVKINELVIPQNNMYRETMRL